MPQSLAQIYIHTVFSTKERIPMIEHDLQPQLYRYMAEVFAAMGCNAVEIGGMADHVHILHSLARTKSIAKVVEEIKRSTSKWMKRKGAGFGKFSWQDGYGAFSVSTSSVSRVRAYILDQETHHQTCTLQDEYLRILQKHNVAYDERYIWT